MEDAERYRLALLDWLACAAGGWDEPAARAARAGADAVAALGVAGHVLDFDDTWLPGIAHLSAPTAPAALALAAERGATVADALRAYAAGLEAMAALAGAGYPSLYDGGWHPTAVCGTVGAAVAAACLLGLDEVGRDAAAGLAALRAAGLRAAFGADGKALQVGLAASAGVSAARLAAAGARVDAVRIHAGWEQAYGAPWASERATPAIRENWIKAYPCCLQTHGAIECAQMAAATVPTERIEGREEAAATLPTGTSDGGGEAAATLPTGTIEIRAHPVSRQAASYDDVTTPLQAKFSIPYTAAYTLLHGPPTVASFATVDAAARALAARITVRTEATLGESEFRLFAGGRELAHVEAARGSPARPLSGDALAAKVRELASTRLDGALDDGERPAAEVLARLAGARAPSAASPDR